MRENAASSEFTMASPSNTIGSGNTPTYTFLAGETVRFERMMHQQSFIEQEPLGYFVATSGTIAMQGIAYE